MVKNMEKLEVAFMAILWEPILERFHVGSVSLQEEMLDICAWAHLLGYFTAYIATLCESFQSFEEQVFDLSDVMSRNHVFNSKKTLNTSTSPCLMKHERIKLFWKALKSSEQNHFIQLLIDYSLPWSSHISAYKVALSKFRFLSNLTEMSSENIFNAATDLQECYPKDLVKSFP